MLHLGFNISQSNIAIADYPRFHPKINGTGFRQFRFDMLKEWPDFKEKFDYILFPESLNIATLNYKDEMTVRFHEDVKRITKLCEEGKCDDLLDSDISFFIDLMEQDASVVKVRYEIVNRAIKNLKVEGEVRISSGIKGPQQKAYMQLRLRNDGVNVSYPNTKYPNQFFIKLKK